jgi:acetate---CoA ligase (ADP-forming)
MSSTFYSIDEILQPRSVAILGASRTTLKWGHVASSLLIYGGFP